MRTRLAGQIRSSHWQKLFPGSKATNAARSWSGGLAPTLAFNTMSRAISKATWDQIKIARAAGASYDELAERTGISKGTILAHAHRNGWTKDIALARPKADRQPPTHNVTDAITAILHERGQETKIKMSEFLLKAARQLAERDDIVVDSLEGAKILEALRSSLYPQPIQLDHRSLSVNLQGGLSEEALQRIEAMTKL